MFTDATILKRLTQGCIDTDDWQPFPFISQRDEWQRIIDNPALTDTVNGILKHAGEILDKDIDPLTGSMYMSFMRNGDRVGYEENYFRRRSELSKLVIAECLTNQRKYLDKIIDYMWAILGEVYWCVPAHNFAHHHEMVIHKEVNPWNENDPFPDPNDEYLDLFNCETAGVLAEACFLLKPLMLEEVPALYHLVRQEVEQRSLSKLESHKLYGWYHGKNNWTVWCAHNLLVAACYFIEDKNRLVSIADKLLLTVHRFFENLEDSGSCIEGPTYWNVSAGRFGAFIKLIEDRFQLELGIEKHAKFQHFGQHIRQLHMGNNSFANFADGSLKIDLDHGMISAYAQKLDQKEPIVNLLLEDADRFAKFQLTRSALQRGHNDYLRQTLLHLSRLLFWLPKLEKTLEQSCNKSVWLNDMQVLIARDSDLIGKGMAVTAIAGTNDNLFNHHSHNDVGHFGLYYDGEPILIDLGQGAYTKDTFSEKRYDIWHISSEGHHVPKINGHRQICGEGTHAEDVEYSYNGTTSTLSFDSCHAYPKEARLQTAKRRIEFDHANSCLIISDELHLDETLETLEVPLYVSNRQITQTEAGDCLIDLGNRYLVVTAENLNLINIEKVPITDERHVEVWGEHIYKVLFKANDLTTPRFKLHFHLKA